MSNWHFQEQAAELLAEELRNDARGAGLRTALGLLDMVVDWAEMHAEGCEAGRLDRRLRPIAEEFWRIALLQLSPPVRRPAR